MSLIPFGFWAASGGGGAANAYDLLETTTLTSNTASVTFSGLGDYSDYAHLQIRIVSRTSDATTNANINLNFNGDTGTNYATHDLEGNGTSVGSGSAASIANIRVAQNIGTSLADAWPAAVIDILDFSSGLKNTTTRTLNGWASSSTPRIFLRSGLWNDTSAVTSMSFALSSGDFIAASRLSLYGVK